VSEFKGDRYQIMSRPFPNEDQDAWEKERVTALVHSKFRGEAEEQLLQILGIIPSPEPDKSRDARNYGSYG
jgi:hypothetical protein